MPDPVPAAEALLREFRELLEPVGRAAALPQPDGLSDLLSDAYIDDELLFEAGGITDVATAVGAAWTRVEALTDADFSGAGFAAAKAAVLAVWSAVQQVRALRPRPGAPADIAAEVADRLADHLLGLYLLKRAPRVLRVLEILTLAEAPDVAARASWRFHPGRLANWAADPAAVRRDVIGWGTAGFAPSLWVDRIAALVRATGPDPVTGWGPPDLWEDDLTPPDPVPPVLTAVLPLIDDPDAGVMLNALLQAAPASAAGDDAGFVLGLAGDAADGATGRVGGAVVTVSASAEITDDVFVSIRPGAVRLVRDGAPVAARLALTAAPAAPGPGPSLAFGPLALTLGRPEISATLRAGAGDGPAFDARLDLRDSRIALDGGDADAFVGRLIAGLPEVELDLALGYDTDRGPYLDADGGLVFRRPLMTGGAAPVAVEAFTGRLEPRGTTLALSGGLDLAARLGPIHARAEGIGATLAMDLGRLADAATPEMSFLPPTGIGFRIDTAGITGGGAVARDPDTGRYTGALELQLPSFGLTAFGILDTRIEGRPDAFSLLLLVGSRFSPIPLGFGFTLNGVGGLIGLHRDVDVEALFAAVRTGRAGRLLALEDPVRDAAELGRMASGIFPVTPGQHVFGPTVKLGWGSPVELVTLDLALAVTLPEPLRVILVGTLSAALPDDRVAILRLNVDVAGVLDLSASRFDMEGRIHDSHVQGIPLSGGFALRSAWGRRRELAFSVGGFHPAFEPPPGFPPIERLAADLSAGRALSLRLEGYLAITSNTVQLGAALDLAASAAGFSVQADLGFDALLTLEPFRMEVGIRAGASIRKGSRQIASVRLSGQLAGPGPWSVQGEATLEVLWVDVTLRVSKSFGAAAPALPASVDLEALLLERLGAPAAWGDALGASGGHVVLGPLNGALAPDAPLRVVQDAMPLDVALSLAGGRPLGRPFTARILGARVGALDLAPSGSIERPFAQAQFVPMTEAEALQAPPFADLPAGAAFAPADATRAGPAATAPAGPELIVIDAAPRPPEAAPPRTALSRRETPMAPEGRIAVRDEPWIDATGQEGSFAALRGTGRPLHRAGEAA